VSDEREEISLDDYRARPIRMIVHDQPFRNQVGIGFNMDVAGKLYAADLSGVVFRPVDRSPASLGPGFIHAITVDRDLLDRVIPYLVEISGESHIYRVSEAERGSQKAHVDDLRKVTQALLDMQRVIIGKEKP